MLTLKDGVRATSITDDDQILRAYAAKEMSQRNGVRLSIEREQKGVAHLEVSGQGRIRLSAHSAVIMAQPAPGMAWAFHRMWVLKRIPVLVTIVSTPSAGSHPSPIGIKARQRSQQVSLSLSLLTRGTPRELSVPGLTHRVRTQHSAPAACWLHPSRGSRPRQLSPLPGSENVWMGRHRANQNRQVHGHPPPFTAPHACPRIPHAANDVSSTNLETGIGLRQAAHPIRSYSKTPVRSRDWPVPCSNSPHSGQLPSHSPEPSLCR